MTVIAQASSVKRPLVIDGDRVLLRSSLALLLFSLIPPASLALGWSSIVILISFPGLMLSPAFFLLSCWEMARYKFTWRALIAALFSLIATVAGWGSLALIATGKFH